MTTDTWGKCEDCKMWQIEPEAPVAAATMGLCVAEKLETYHIRVSGDSGCSVFKSGEVQRAAGSSEAPPKAVA